MTTRLQKPKGFPLVISAPSGTGKSTLCQKLLQRDKTLRYSVSCTTRPPRAGERNRRDYHFLTAEEFKDRMHDGEFLEWAIVHGAYYGTPRRPVEAWVAQGRVAILAIDVQGARSVRRKRPDTVTIFLMPPSWRSLEERLHRRRDPEDVVQSRLADAPLEIEQAKSYDYLVVNDSLDRAVGQVQAIIAAEKLKMFRQDLSPFRVKEEIAR